MRQVNLEFIKQGEVGQKEGDKYCILAHAYGIQKEGKGGVIYISEVIGIFPSNLDNNNKYSIVASSDPPSSLFHSLFTTSGSIWMQI